MLNAPKNLLNSKNESRTLRKRRRWLLISMAGSVAVSAAFLAPTHNQALPLPAVDVAPVAVLMLTHLPARQDIGRMHGNPFVPRSWAPPPPSRLERDEAPPPLSAPPLPYRFAGTIHYDDTLKVVLALGDRIYEATVGELLDGLYRVRVVTPDAVTLVYTPLGIEQHLAYVPAASGQAGFAQPSLHSPSERVIAEHLPPFVTYQGPRAPSPFPPGSPLATR
jgi:hypothetical protein